MLEPSPCVGAGCEPLLEMGLLFLLSPVIAAGAFMDALIIGAGLAVVAGALYAIVVFGTGGHVGALWMRDPGAPPLWRVRWFTLATSGYLLGLATFASLSVPSPGGLALVATALFSSLVALNVAAERPLTSAGLEWLPIGAVTLCVALAARLLVGARAPTIAVAVIWTLGAVLSALEVPVAVGRLRAALTVRATVARSEERAAATT